jgi:hypothetical protein
MFSPHRRLRQLYVRCFRHHPLQPLDRLPFLFGARRVTLVGIDTSTSVRGLGSTVVEGLERVLDRIEGLVWLFSVSGGGQDIVRLSSIPLPKSLLPRLEPKDFFLRQERGILRPGSPFFTFLRDQLRWATQMVRENPGVDIDLVLVCDGGPNDPVHPREVRAALDEARALGIQLHVSCFVGMYSLSQMYWFADELGIFEATGEFFIDHGANRAQSCSSAFDSVADFVSHQRHGGRSPALASVPDFRAPQT